MHRYRVPFNGSGASYPVRLSAGYTTNTSESEFSVHTAPSRARGFGASGLTRVTEKQGQYLAYIYAYTRLHRRPPPEADMQQYMQQYFRVNPPSVHQMVLTLERAGFIRR